LEVAGFLARIKERFQMLISGVLLRNKRRFKASFLAISAGFHRRMREIFHGRFNTKTVKGRGAYVSGMGRA